MCFACGSDGAREEATAAALAVAGSASDERSLPVRLRDRLGF